MLLYTGIYNPNSLPVKHYRFRLDFNFWRIIALAHIRMSLQYAQRQQQHRETAGARAAEPPAQGPSPATLMLPVPKHRGHPQITAMAWGESRPPARGSRQRSDCPQGMLLPPRWDGAVGFLTVVLMLHIARGQQSLHTPQLSPRSHGDTMQPARP